MRMTTYPLRSSLGPTDTLVQFWPASSVRKIPPGKYSLAPGPVNDGQPPSIAHNGHVWNRRVYSDRNNSGVHKPAIELGPCLASVIASVQAVFHIWAKGWAWGVQRGSHDDIWVTGRKVDVPNFRITPLFGVEPSSDSRPGNTTVPTQHETVALRA